MTAVNYVLSSFEGNINHRYPTGLKLYLRSTKEIDKENDKLDISVSNSKCIVDHFLSSANKYGWVRLAFMVITATGAKDVFIVAEQIQLASIKEQAHVYFGLQVILNIDIALTIPLTVSDLDNLVGGDAVEI